MLTSHSTEGLVGATHQLTLGTCSNATSWHKVERAVVYESVDMHAGSQGLGPWVDTYEYDGL
jgi:hypothetical protein